MSFLKTLQGVDPRLGSIYFGIYCPEIMSINFVANRCYSYYYRSYFKPPEKTCENLKTNVIDRKGGY